MELYILGTNHWVHLRQHLLKFLEVYNLILLPLTPMMQKAAVMALLRALPRSINHPSMVSKHFTSRQVAADRVAASVLPTLRMYSLTLCEILATLRMTPITLLVLLAAWPE
jgi:hypothetical protein